MGDLDLGLVKLQQPSAQTSAKFDGMNDGPWPPPELRQHMLSSELTAAVFEQPTRKRLQIGF